MMRKMKAAVFECIEKIVVKEVDIPQCEEDGILVRVEACGICGSDIRNYHSGLRIDIKEQIMGHEIAGVVEEVGRKVKKFKVGDKVAIAPDVSCGECYYCKRGLPNLCLNHRLIGTHWPGGFAQFIYLPAEIISHGIINYIPEGLTFEEATISEPASSVVACQEYNNVSLGDTVVIIGDGPIGCLHLEVARARGASRIIMVGLTRLDIVKKFSPDYLIDAGSQDPVKEVLEITNGLGADIAIVANSAVKTHEQGVEMVRKRGKVIIFGGLPKDKPMTTLNSNLIHYNELSLVGAFSYPVYAHEKALNLIALKKINAKNYIDKIVPLEEIEEGIKYAEQGKALKVVVNPWI
jgi:L-iditol 2-dehydrogenase